MEGGVHVYPPSPDLDLRVNKKKHFKTDLEQRRGEVVEMLSNEFQADFTSNWVCTEINILYSIK